MPIIGFNFDKISAERKAKIQKGMKATHNITINSITQEKIRIENKDKNGLKFSFEFSVKYEPNIGSIFVNGHMLYLEEEKKLKEILKEWEKNKKVKPDIATQIINTAIVRCSIKALTMSQDVNLPPHLPLPIIAPHKKENNYIG